MSGVQLHSIRDVWYHNLEKFPNKVAAIHEGQEHTYRQCDLLSDNVRRELADRFGFNKGDKVAILGPNCFEYFIAYWAAIKSGGIVAPINTRLGDEELSHVIANTDAEILVVHQENWDAARRVLTDCPNIKHVVGVGVDGEEVTRWEGLAIEGEPYDHHPEIGEEDLGIIMHTSGTTGRPKGAVMRHGDLLFNNKLAIYAHSLRHEDVHLLVVPMFHATALYSLLPTSALLGSTICIGSKTDVRYLVELIQAHRVSTFFGVPTLFHFLTMMKDLANYDLRSLRLLAYAGSPMAPVTIKRLRERFPNVMLHNFFGLTETISMTHVLPSKDADVKPESIGKLLPHVSQRILDDDDNEVAPGQVGRLHFHRSDVISTYWKEPDRLEESMRGDWFDTGDLALVDEEGFVFLKGRSKDMIIVGGENVYALEVENCIMTHEKVREAAVIGVPATGIRAYLGELVKAIIVPHEGVELTPPEIKKLCMERLASYKVPQLIEFSDALPRNPSGKVLKRLLS